MMQPDESVDAILNALRAAEPPQGYEARIEDALLRSSSHTAPQRRITWMPFAAAAAVVVLLAGGAGVFVRLHRTGVSNAPSLAKQSVPAQAKSPEIHEAAVAKPGVTHRAVSLSSHRRESLAMAPQRHEEEVAVLTHEYIPEPPLPLTEQERLLLRMVRHDNSPQLAAYTPDAREKSSQKDAEEYRAFFAPPPPLEGQPLYHQILYDQHISGETQ